MAIAAVTGATGFVGKHLIAELQMRGYQIKALTRRPRPAKNNINWISGDLEDGQALAALVKDADVVFHLAGLVKAKSRQSFMAVNAVAVQTLLNIIDRSAAKPHFILLSSLAARERQLSSYANSKRRGEEILTERAKNMPWTILRPPGIYGPHDGETLKIFKAIKYRIAPLPGASQTRASWIYAPDLAKAMVAVAENKDCFGQILEVDDGTQGGYSNREMYQTAADILNVRPFQLVLPKFSLKIIAHINVLFSTIFSYTPMLTPEKINELCHPDWICHGRHVMKITDWKPETNLRQGFIKTLAWYKDNGMI